MVGTGFNDNEINNVIRIVICILFIGNIEFVEDKTVKTGDKCNIDPNSKEIQKFVCDIMNMDFSIFEEAFLFNVRIIKGETIKSPMPKQGCIAFRDTFVKEIYNRIFGFLVKRNKSKNMIEGK